jgi:glycerol uptake facilitator-like aquaporin
MTEAFPPVKRLVAEALGTGLLVATVVGSGIMADKLAGGNVAIALLGNTIPTGAILVVLILSLGPISGAHFNPAVSLVMGITGGLPWRDVGFYALAQIVGGCLGTLTAHGMFLVPTRLDRPDGAGAMVRGVCRHLRTAPDHSGRRALPD